MTDPIATGARAAADRLAALHGPALAAEVEAALLARSGTSRPVQYSDPVSLGALIVAVADFAWTVYRDRRETASAPPPELIARHVRVRFDRGPGTPGPELDSADRDRVIDVVIEETVRSAEDGADAPDRT